MEKEELISELKCLNLHNRTDDRTNSKFILPNKPVSPSILFPSSHLRSKIQNYHQESSPHRSLDAIFSDSFDSALEPSDSSALLDSSNSGEELDQMVQPVFGDYFQNLSFSSDEGFGSSNTSSNAGSPQSAQKRKIRVSQKWKSPIKTRIDPYFLESSPLSLLKKKTESSPKNERPNVLNRPEKIDFIEMLHERQMKHIITAIFGHCGARELQKSSEVSSLWRSYLENEPFESTRRSYREERMKRIRNPNFNRHKVSPNWRNTRKLRSASNHMNRAIAAANQISPISRPQTTSSRVQHLKNVKRNLGLDEEMIYCPVCVYPATKHANNKGMCTMRKCLASFCCLCKLEWHEGPCCGFRTPSPPSSKANIRRKLKKL